MFPLPALGGCKEGGKRCREATAALWELMWRSGGQERQGQGMLMCVSAHGGRVGSRVLHIWGQKEIQQKEQVDTEGGNRAAEEMMFRGRRC